MFTSILDVQTTAVYAAASTAQCPFTSLYSVSNTTVVVDCVLANGNTVANGTVINLHVTGT